MTFVRLCAATTIFSSALLLGNPAAAAETAKGSFAVRAVVPAYCEISSDPVQLSEGSGFQSGSVMELCNSADGFQVVASYRELAPSEQVRFSYAGLSRQLNASGWTPVANRVGAKFGMRPIGVQYSALQSPLAINLTITYF